MKNPFRRFFRRKLVGVPLGQHVPADSADHAEDFARRYAEPMNYHVENRMMDLGIDPNRIGLPDRARGNQWAAFHPHDREGGSNSPEGQLTVDSAVFNLDLLRKDYGEEAARLFEKSKLSDRLDAIIAHEYEESRHGMSHVEALKHAPDTELTISDRAREICRAMRSGWTGR